MVNQKPISFKITLENLGNLDDMISRSRRWTRRNTELNLAVEMYVRYRNAREELHTTGNPALMREFVSKYLHMVDKPLFG